MEGDLPEEGGHSGAQTDADDLQEPLDAADAPPADGTSETKSSRFRGVSWHRKSGRWRATIKLQGNKVQIGAYKDEEEAARAFDGAAVKFRGSSANTNFDISDYLAEQIEHEERAQLQVPLVSKSRNPSGHYLDMSSVPVFAGLSHRMQPGPPPVLGHEDVPDCDVDMEQKELALQWARAKFYHEELAAQGSTKPAKRARGTSDLMRAASKDEDPS